MRTVYDRFMPARVWIDEHISIERVSGNRDGARETVRHLIAAMLNTYLNVV